MFTMVVLLVEVSPQLGSLSVSPSAKTLTLAITFALLEVELSYFT